MREHFNTREKNCYDYGCTDDCPVSLAKQVLPSSSSKKWFVLYVGWVTVGLLMVLGIPVSILLSDELPVKAPPVTDYYTGYRDVEIKDGDLHTIQGFLTQVIDLSKAQTITFSSGPDSTTYFLEAFTCHAHDDHIVCEYDE